MIFGEGPDMDDTPATEDRDPLNLRVLRILVTVLTVTMIVGLITVTLPEGETARAVTFGPDWYAVVTANDLILIYDRASGDLRQTVTID